MKLNLLVHAFDSHLQEGVVFYDFDINEANINDEILDSCFFAKTKKIKNVEDVNEFLIFCEKVFIENIEKNRELRKEEKQKLKDRIVKLENQYQTDLKIPMFFKNIF